MIHFEDVSVTYEGAAAPSLAHADFTLPEGELTLLVGPSGVGKSTLLGAVSGLVPHFTGGTLKGRVTVAGRDTRTHKPRELADVVGTVGQDPLAHFVTDVVEDELAYGMESLGLPPSVMRRRVEETLDLLGLNDLRDRPIATLSGGQQQRVAIGSVLTPHPKVLVLDEPTSALDPAAAEEVLAVLQRLVHDLGTTVLMAEHRLERVVQYADRVLLLPSPGAPAVLDTPAAIMAISPVHPPVVALGRLAHWTPLPLSIRDARRRATPLLTRLTEAGAGAQPPADAGAEPQAGSGAKPGAGAEPQAGSGAKPGAGAQPQAGSGAKPGAGAQPQAGSGAKPGAGAQPQAGSGAKPGAGAQPQAGSGAQPGAGAQPQAGSGAKPGAGAQPQAGSGAKPGAGAQPQAGSGAQPGAGAQPQAGSGAQPGAGAQPQAGSGAQPGAGAQPQAGSGAQPGAGAQPQAGSGAQPGAGAQPQAGSGAQPGAGAQPPAGSGAQPGSGAEPRKGSGAEPRGTGEGWVGDGRPQGPRTRRGLLARLRRRGHPTPQPTQPTHPTHPTHPTQPAEAIGKPPATVKAVSLRRGRAEVLRDINLTVAQGETIALMGRNGAGKSTLLATLIGTLEPTTGQITVSGRTPHRTPPAEMVTRVGLVPQEPRDLLYADTVAAECTAADHDAGQAPGTCRALVAALLPDVPDDTHPRDLSEGQRLALALALVLTGRPALLLLDEPTRGLDYAAKARLVEILRGLAADGHAIVLATHDVELAAELAHRVVILAGGEIVADGPTAEVVVSSPAFAPQVAKILAPGHWLTVSQVEAALSARDAS
ncbi:ATP-binding cassette domain-containing protein [Streptomyces sp. ZAF1911]|uniref:ATP-binding cassette domain-containing protein n=1 Tax=Streptomyces sp. ZAF1911 TaxID=2944129 RepID=UPI00237B3664|nr:ATP-binding cassette domain-containing protein [Streptomyces sp. ZAF1911]MDD9381463.1 ATP-binding cassette domain-containing protein [Streptomyces sp. ZAF1911]